MPYSNIDKPSKYFNTITWTGNGTSQSLTGVGFQPDWVWIKKRSGGTARSHQLYDVIRTATKYLHSDATDAEGTFANGLTAFNSDGFSIGDNDGVNGNTYTYVGWSWDANGAGVSNTSGTISSTVSANTTSGFSIVSYTGTGATATVGHGLGAVPKFIIYKQRNTARNWYVFTSVIDGSYDNLYLNNTDAKVDRTITLPTSSVFSLSSSNEHNESAGTYIAYCFAEVKGFSKAFSYTGNGSSDGNFVYCGFRPAFVLIKNTSIAQDWFINDNKRLGYNGGNYVLYPDLSSAEASSPQVDILSNGFKTRTVDAMINNSGYSYVGFAFAEQPFVSSKGIVANAR